MKSINPYDHDETKNLSLEPNKRQAFIEELHKKDMKNLSFCKLDFGNLLAEKPVRDRAIADRIKAIHNTPILRQKFEREFSEIKRIRKKSILAEMKDAEDHVKINKNIKANMDDQNQKRLD